MEASSALLKDLEKEGYYLTEKGLASCLESASGKSEIRNHIHNVSRLSKILSLNCWLISVTCTTLRESIYQKEVHARQTMWLV